MASLIDEKDNDIISNENFPFATSKKLTLKLEDGGRLDEILALRMTFVGELGYEIYSPIDSCYSLVNTLMNNKEGVMVSFLII